MTMTARRMMQHTFWCGHTCEVHTPRDTDEDYELNMSCCPDCVTAIEELQRPLRDAVSERDREAVEHAVASRIAARQPYPYATLPYWLAADDETPSESLDEILCWMDDRESDRQSAYNNEDGISAEMHEYLCFGGEWDTGEVMARLEKYIDQQIAQAQ